MNRETVFLSLAAMFCGAGMSASADLLANGNFEDVANGRPVGWTASSAAGGFVAPGKGVNGSTALGVEGVGTNNCKWLSAPVLLEPNRLYGFSVKVNAHQGGGLTMGTPDENVTESFADTQGEWVEKRMVVVSADRPKSYGEVFRLGEYRLNGRFLFDEARVVPITARYAEKAGVQLGHGEKLGGNAYSFSTRLSCAARVHARPLYRQRIGFNSNRWSFGKGQSITYRHTLAGRRFLSGKAFFTCGVLPPGSGAKIVVEASTDGKTWVKVGEQVEIPAPGIAFDLPKSLFPAENVYVRFGGERLMVDGYTFTGDVDGSPVYLAGETKYVNEQDDSVFISEEAGPDVLEEACGARLPAVMPGGVLWTASSGWKIPRRRLAPTATVDAVRVKTAANEAEAVQLCLTADEDFADVRVTVAEDAVAKTWGLIEKGRLAAARIQVARMGYVPVNRVTDYLGSVGLHADPILPQTQTALAVAKGETQPFWIRVKPPKGTPKGVYRTTLTVCARTSAGDVRQAEVPLEIEVFGFTLPDTMTLKVPFGFGEATVFRFHRAKTEAQRELLFERYLQALADCHISPYSLTRAKQKVTWTKDRQPVLDWAAWDEGVEKAMAKYHFTTIRISSLGLGSGDEASSRPGQVPGTKVKEGSPDYELLVGRYLKAVQDHFEQKGWLDKVFVYCYDEPQSSADAFVMRGFGLLEKYAPKLRRMLTAPPRDSLIGGPHIWCPVAPGLQSSNTPKRRAAGDEFWWYCCMCPRAPYLSLFIDHPGVELRTWLWQTWGEKLTGALIWNTTWWTSDLIYPKGKPPQNAYEDTMSWSPRAWRPGTNGDGRMFYPPPACFDGGTAFVDAMPVPTRRVEMIRDGVEDYEYFAMLRQKNPNHPLLQVPADVYSSLTAYNYDPAALEAHREKLARALED